MLNPSRLRIIAIGKIRKQWLQEAVGLYLKRLPGLTVTELRDSDLQRESNMIHSVLRKNEKLIALTEEGENLNSINFTKRLQKFGSQRLAFLIGGADGLSPQIKNSAYWQLSLSSLTFPHEIARLLLLEQLYRAQTILQGTSYHRQ